MLVEQEKIEFASILYDGSEDSGKHRLPDEVPLAGYSEVLLIRAQPCTAFRHSFFQNHSFIPSFCCIFAYQKLNQ